MDLAEPSGRYLSFAEREEIAICGAQKLGVREIARRVGRAASTISRELHRNAGQRQQPFRLPRLDGAVACRTSGVPAEGEQAGQQRSAARARAGQVRCRGHWSPEQISARLQLDFAEDESMRVSHEAIYQALYVQGRGALRRELTACLRTGRAVRKPRDVPGARQTIHPTPRS